MSVEGADPTVATADYSKKHLKLKPAAGFDAALHCVVIGSSVGSSAAIALAGERWISLHLNLVGGVNDSTCC